MTLAVNIPSWWVKELAPPLFSAMRRTDWIPTPLPLRLEDWNTPFFS